MKTTKEIRQLQAVARTFLKALPLTDEYGYPTDEERVEMETIIDECNRYLAEGICCDEAVQSWLDGPDEYGLAEYYLEE